MFSRRGERSSRRACTRPDGGSGARWTSRRSTGSAPTRSVSRRLSGQRKHAIAHYLDLVVDGRVDLRPMLTHTFRLEQWREAFLAIANQGESGAVKVAIDFR